MGEQQMSQKGKLLTITQQVFSPPSSEFSFQVISIETTACSFGQLLS